jgi:hypothetical protein
MRAMNNGTAYFASGFYRRKMFIKPSKGQTRRRRRRRKFLSGQLLAATGAPRLTQPPQLPAAGTATSCGTV